jgi:phosphoribosylformylglycinamidine synthase subunit PurSL
MAKVVEAYEMPLISGKDSMKNDFSGELPSGQPVQISVLPTLLVTAMGFHPDVSKALKPHASPGSVLYCLGVEFKPGFDPAESAKKFNPIEAKQFYQSFYASFLNGVFQSAHDVSEGGWLFAVMESLLLNRGGIKLEASSVEQMQSWFAEVPAQFVVSVLPSQEAELKRRFQANQVRRLGEVIPSGIIELKVGSKSELISLTEFEAEYRNGVPS